MRLLCPTCRDSFDVDPDSLQDGSHTSAAECGVTCPQGHRFMAKNGVLALLDDEFGGRLRTFLSSFSELRAADGKRLVDPIAYPELPAGVAVQDDFEWRLRQYDLQVIAGLLADRPQQRVLDVGAWNGWLSNRLAAMGHSVTAVDYFTDEFDGLQARKFYATRWLAIQMNLEDLAVLDQPFDLVIINRCLQFYADPTGYAQAARQKVAANGLMVLTGLAFVRDARQRQAGMVELRSHLNQYGLDFFKPMKGYLDFQDKARLESLGFELRPYPQLRLANLKSLVDDRAPRYYYGLSYAR